MRLIDLLTKQSKNGRIPFHMPGHMRGEFDHLVGSGIDFTEIDGLDDLHAPGGILKDAMGYAASVFGARRTFFLVNGSSGGILSAIRAVAKKGGSVVLSRSCHKSVYNALALSNLRAEYLYPPIHPLGFPLEVSPESVEAALSRTPDACAVVITSPTYDGVISDVRAIAEICHKSRTPLIVDSAHGAHLGFLDKSVRSAVECGADITVMSLHKTMPSLTQTALLHVNGDLVDADAALAALSVFETSSPSYILMASIDGCVRLYNDSDLFARWRENIAQIHAFAEGSAVRLIRPDCFAFDESKLIVSSRGYTGAQLGEILRRSFNIEPEMVSREYVLLMTGAGTTEEHVCALKNFISSLEERDSREYREIAPPPICEAVMGLGEATLAESVTLPLEECDGRISAELIMPYPPGIPLVAPGERLSREMIEYIRSLEQSGVRITTSAGGFCGKIRVIRQKN